MEKEKVLAITATETQGAEPNQERMAFRRPRPNRYKQHISKMPRILDEIALPDESKCENTSRHQSSLKKKRRRIAGSPETTVSSYWTSSVTLDVLFQYFPS